MTVWAKNEHMSRDFGSVTKKIIDSTVYNERKIKIKRGGLARNNEVSVGRSVY